MKKEMKRILLSGVMMVVLAQLSIAQTINGVVIDEGSSQPIAFANIGVLNSKIGTYTADDGAFSLELSGDIGQLVLVISAIGYEAKRIPLNDVNITKKLKILLTSKNYELGEFTVEDSRLKTKTVGNRRLPLLNMAWTADAPKTRIGKTIAIRLNLRQNPPIRIDEVSIGVYENPWEETRYRLRIMSIGSTGKPEEDIVNLNKISIMTEREGWVHFNFEGNSPVVTINSFFLVVENIDNEGVWRDQEGRGYGLFPIYMFNAVTLSKQPVYLSNEGLQEWNKKSKDPTFRLKYAYE